MTKDQLKGKNIGIFGLGVEGESSAGFLVKHGARVTVFDQRTEESFDPSLLRELLHKGVTYVFGDGAFSQWKGMDMIVRAPGIRRSLPEILAAEREGVVITSQTQLFFDFSPVELIGVTGTKGKGTTSSLIYEMLKAEGKDTYLGGNIGTPPFNFIEKLTQDSKVVLELSSFQLEDLHKSPHIAVMLMVTSEHLAADTTGTANYHNSLSEYVAAKRNILSHQTKKDIVILNGDYSATIESGRVTPATAYTVSREQIEEGDGCYVKEGVVWIRIKGKEERVIRVEDIFLPGTHNHENVCAASMAAYVSGVSIETIRQVLKEFRGLEHRLERVAEVNGVTYYDDSFSTTPETAIAAIQSFTAPKVLILGGSTKASDFSHLARTIAETKQIRGIIGIGAEWERIKKAFVTFPAHIPVVEGLTEMSSIVRAAAEMAQAGDVVLLSPACASFGLFPNYKVRGDQFKMEVRTLSETASSIA